MPNNNSINTPLRGTTGSGSYVGSDSPTIITPNISGVLDGSEAISGDVGEYFFQGSLIVDAISLSSGIASNIFNLTTSIPRGDWDVFGTVIFNPDVTTTSISMIAGLSLVSNTLPVFGSGNNISFANINFAAGQSVALTVGPYRHLDQFPDPVFLVAQATFAISTMSVYGYLSARRIR